MRKARSERRQSHCTHVDTVQTVSAGIVRTVCERCGHVSLRHHHDLVEIGRSEGAPGASTAGQ